MTRIGRARSIGALATTALLAACSGGGSADDDTGPARDAMVVDSTLWNDASIDAGQRLDAGPTLDAGPALCGGGCDPRSVGACGSDMACRLVSGIPACVAAAPPDGGMGADGSRCAHDADCGSGLSCFGMAGGLGTCGRLCCDGRPMDCAPSERCRGDGALVDGTTTSWGRCLPPIACDLAHPEHACAANEGCYIVDGMGTTECLHSGGALPGAPCERPWDCVPGYACTGLTARTCIAICMLASTAPHQGCGDTEHCEAQAYSPPGSGICTGG